MTVGAARRPAVLLAVGVVALEFAAAVSTFVSATLLPTVARDLDARDHLALLLAGSTIGLFVALPLAPAVLGRVGPARTLSIGLVSYVGGAVAAAAAPDGWVFAAGRLVGGLGGGLLAVFGVSAVIRHLDEHLRVRVVAASSAMWIVPAFVAPPGTLALAHAVGWRWTLLAPVPIVLAGRVLVVRAAGDGGAAEPARRPAGRTLLVPVGVAVLVLTSTGGRWWPLTAAGALLALVGVVGIMPAGTARARPGTPAALAAMVLFATGWFGADSLITIMLTDGYGTGLGGAAVVLSAAPLAWAGTSLLVPRLVRGGRRPPAAAGLALAAGGVAVLAAGPVGPTGYAAALVSWTLAGVGIGLAYPGLYVQATTPDPSVPPAELATAVITAEAFGGLLGGAAGGAAVSLSLAAGLARADGLALAYGGFAAVLAAGALVALRATRTPAAAAPGSAAAAAPASAPRSAAAAAPGSAAASGSAPAGRPAASAAGAGAAAGVDAGGGR